MFRKINVKLILRYDPPNDLPQAEGYPSGVTIPVNVEISETGQYTSLNSVLLCLRYFTLKW